MTCEACAQGEHWFCGRQTWCACDCDPERAGVFDFDPLDPYVAREFGIWDVFDDGEDPPPQEDPP